LHKFSQTELCGIVVQRTKAGTRQYVAAGHE
jgi:hypothetical protein